MGVIVQLSLRMSFYSPPCDSTDAEKCAEFTSLCRIVVRPQKINFCAEYIFLSRRILKQKCRLMFDFQRYPYTCKFLSKRIAEYAAEFLNFYRRILQQNF